MAGEPELDEVVIDEPEFGPASTRCPTRPLDGTLEITVEDGEGIAQFLELMARLLRVRKRVRVRID